TFPFDTVDGRQLTHNFSLLSGHPFGIAPTSDDQYLWISIAEDNRVFRLTNPIPPTVTPTGPTPTGTRAPTLIPALPKVDIVLGQTDVDRTDCNSQRVTWDPNSLVNVTATDTPNS